MAKKTTSPADDTSTAIDNLMPPERDILTPDEAANKPFETFGIETLETPTADTIAEAAKEQEDTLDELGIDTEDPGNAVWVNMPDSKKRYNLKPQTVLAEAFTGKLIDGIEAYSHTDDPRIPYGTPVMLTEQGVYLPQKGDMVLTYDNGAHELFSADMFDKLFEPVPQDTANGKSGTV